MRPVLLLSPNRELASRAAPLRRGRRRVAVVLALVTISALTACSGNSKHATPPKATTTPARDATAATAATRATGVTGTGVAAPAEVAVARNLVLQPGDLPAGWHAIAAPAPGALVSPARQCVAVAAARRGIERAQGGPVPSASSAFGQGTGRVPVIRSYAYVLSTVSLAAQAFNAITSAAYIRCVTLELTAAGGYSFPRYSAVSVARLGDDAAGNRVTVQTSAGGASFETRVDVVAVRTGRVVQQLTFVDADLLPIAPAVRARVLAALATHGRASAAKT
jgi:hypothetical protein